MREHENVVCEADYYQKNVVFRKNIYLFIKSLQTIEKAKLNLSAAFMTLDYVRSLQARC